MKITNLEQYFWSKVKITKGCWFWNTRSTGYGQISMGNNRISVHRYSYELLVADIPKGLQIDHLCRNTLCVNPWHLEPVTRKINILRGISCVAKNARKTHCPKRHEYSKENTYIRPKDGGRDCKECQRNRVKKYRGKKK